MFDKNYISLLMRFGMTLVLLSGMFGTSPVMPVAAATLTVITTNDSGAGSLRQAVADAVSGDTITFDLSLAGQTITLASDLTIDKNLTIDGSGLSPQITISGGDVAKISVVSSPVITISNLTITNGNAGAIFSGGNLTIQNSTLKNNAGWTITVNGS